MASETLQWPITDEQLKALPKDELDRLFVSLDDEGQEAVSVALVRVNGGEAVTDKQLIAQQWDKCRTLRYRMKRRAEFRTQHRNKRLVKLATLEAYSAHLISWRVRDCVLLRAEGKEVSEICGQLKCSHSQVYRYMQVAAPVIVYVLSDEYHNPPSIHIKPLHMWQVLLAVFGSYFLGLAGFDKP